MVYIVGVCFDGLFCSIGEGELFWIVLLVCSRCFCGVIWVWILGVRSSMGVINFIVCVVFVFSIILLLVYWVVGVMILDNGNEFYWVWVVRKLLR